MNCENTDDSKVDDFLNREHINIIKQTKKNEIEFDLKPHIYEFSFDKNAYRMLIDASSSGNIKPLSVIEEYARFCGIQITPSKYQIIREEFYTYDDDHRLVPLEALGEDF